ncbi:hypothetical protein KKH3_19030 [Pectobacterium actinidiae]|nr:hypothetical protein KKH3_19030 [Pectobacterium actinidiae]
MFFVLCLQCGDVDSVSILLTTAYHKAEMLVYAEAGMR